MTCHRLFCEKKAKSVFNKQSFVLSLQKNEQCDFGYKKKKETSNIYNCTRGGGVGRSLPDDYKLLLGLKKILEATNLKKLKRKHLCRGDW
jgi:hypothetical protein